jgi:hypothetical protein
MCISTIQLKARELLSISISSTFPHWTWVFGVQLLTILLEHEGMDGLTRSMAAVPDFQQPSFAR